jgi:hypothetical protein
MLSRYRALIDHVAGGGAERDPYDALLFVAHSQGTVLTAAALFGDPWRLPAAEPLATACPEITLPPRVSLLTFGSPLLQTYGARFPGQYGWVAAPLAHPDRLRPLTGEWVNVYRAGDYVGRALWGEGPDEILYDPGHPGVTRTRGGLTIRERCIGDGTHTGYWSDPLWGVHLVRAIRAAAGEPAPWPPEPPG